MRLVLAALALLLADPAAAQVARLPTRRIVSRGWPAAAAPAAQPSDARADAAPVTPRTSDAPPAAPAISLPVGGSVTAESVVPPRAQLFGQTGLRVALPPGWASAADEARLPAYALYTFTAPAGDALAGVVLRVEGLTGLNPAEEQGWRSGAARAGYHGARPVGPFRVPVEALVAVETAGPGIGGATAFVQRGRTFWAVSVVAPAATWTAHRADVVALMAGVSFTAPTDAGPQTAPRTAPRPRG